MAIERESDSAYYIAKSGEALKIAEQFRKDWLREERKIRAFINKNFKADQFLVGFSGHLIGISFVDEKKIPEGFKKPDRRGMSFPYQKSDWTKKLAAAGRRPHPADYFKDVPCSISYAPKKGKYPSGFYRIGRFEPVQINWYDEKGPLLVTLPDVKQYLADFPKQHPKCNITNEEILKWKVPAGLKPILVEEWDLMAAKHNKQTKKAA